MEDIAKLCEKLNNKSKPLEPSIILDILKELKKAHVTEETVHKTGIMITLKDLSRHEDKKVSERAKEMKEHLIKVLKESTHKVTPKSSPASTPKSNEKKPEKSSSSSNLDRKPSSSSTDSLSSQFNTQELIKKHSTGLPARDTLARMLLDGLIQLATSQQEAEAAAKIASSIEREVRKLFSDEGDYKAKIRSLVFNLKDPSNPDLRRQVFEGVISPSELPKMSAEDMASEEKKNEREKLAKELINDAVIPKVTNATNQFRCGKCGKNETTYYQLQTRSADEPMTTFVTCVNCGNRWKFS